MRSLTFSFFPPELHKVLISVSSLLSTAVSRSLSPFFLSGMPAVLILLLHPFFQWYVALHALTPLYWESFCRARCSNVDAGRVCSWSIIFIEVSSYCNLYILLIELLELLKLFRTSL